MLTDQELEELKKKYASQLAMTPEARAKALEWYLEMMGEPTEEMLKELAEFDAKRKLNQNDMRAVEEGTYGKP